MNPLQWFKDRIGKKVVVSTKDGHNTVKVLSEPHAEALHRTQSKVSSDGGSPDYSYRHQEDDEDDFVTPMVYTALLSELESNSNGGSQETSSDTPSPEFGGGDFAGGGASGSWADDNSSSSSSDTSSDSGSSDSGSSDSGSSDF
jgi:uncharacterized membrane protein YgcG